MYMKCEHCDTVFLHLSSAIRKSEDLTKSTGVLHVVRTSLTNRLHIATCHYFDVDYVDVTKG